jgi:hypothetical protein
VVDLSVFWMDLLLIAVSVEAFDRFVMINPIDSIGYDDGLDGVKLPRIEEFCSLERQESRLMKKIEKSINSPEHV